MKRMISGRASWLGRAAIAAFVAGAGAAPVSAQSTVDRTHAFDSDGAFRIMVMEGTVRARAWDRDSIRVVARFHDGARRGFYMGVTPDGAGGKMGVEGNDRADVEVTVPRGASLWIKTAGGTIDVAGIEGSLDAFTVTGAMRLEGSPRSLHAESMGGAIAVEGDPRVARVRTGAGAVTVRGGGQDLSLSTVSGRIDLTATAPLRRVQIETVGGEVLVRAALTAGSTLGINSHDGPVDLALPEGTSAEFVVSTLEGELRNGLTAGGIRKGTGLRGRELSFTTGFGGADVTVRTFSGDVTVRPLP